MNDLDLWPALGVTAGAVFVAMLTSVFVYSLSITIETVDAINIVLGAVILAVFTYIYYRHTSVKPSIQSGFYLGCVMVAYTFSTGFLSGYLASMQGAVVPELPPPAIWIIWTSLLMGFVVPMLVGNYLSKRR